MKTTRFKSERGQGMVEFVILLSLILTICAGMLYSSRLLTFEFWAQQEARYLAFEQDWAPHSFYNNPYVDPVTKLANGYHFHRPNVVDGLDAIKKTNDAGDVNDLLAFHNPSGSGFARKAAPKLSGDEPVMMASNANSIWFRRTSWWKSDGDLSVLPSAYATEDLAVNGIRREKVSRDEPPREPEVLSVEPANELQRGFVHLAEQTGFGIRFCEAMNSAMKENAAGVGSHARRVSALFGGADCARRYDRAFGVYLAENADFREYFLDYKFQLESGFDAAEALEISSDKLIASGFYSFFDDLVQNANSNAVSEVGDHTLETSTDLIGDDQYQRLLTQLRYMGSNVALLSISNAIAQTGAFNHSNRDAEDELNFENAVNSVLHADAETPGGFVLSLDYTPFQIMQPLFPGLFSGIMRNVLAEEFEPNDPEKVLIDQSNKLTEVHYTAQNGLFPAAIRRFKTTDKVLSSRFYLVTQPWHIPRRENSTGPYRQLGEQDDDKDTSSTDEALLRRRVFGLYFIPSDVVALLEPITDLVPGIDPVLDMMDVFSSGFAEVKDFLLDNPVGDIFQAMQDIPGFDQFDFSPPEFPAVRPQAYPRSTEIHDDKSTGSEREYKDFVQEQLDNDPPADPEYH